MTAVDWETDGDRAYQVCPICGEDPTPDCTLCGGAGILDYGSDDVDAGDPFPTCPECGRRVEVRCRGDVPGKRPCRYCDHCGTLEYFDE